MRGVICAFFVLMTLAVRPAQAEARPPFDPINFGDGQTVIEISDPAQIPIQLQRAIDRERCRFVSLKQFPIQLIRPEGRSLTVFALVHCVQGVLANARLYVFEGSRTREPERIHLPIIARQRGFQIDPGRTGIFTWDGDAQTLSLTTGSDICPVRILRHVYLHTPALRIPFVLDRVEVSEPVCDSPKVWETYWQASDWPELDPAR